MNKDEFLQQLETLVKQWRDIDKDYDFGTLGAKETLEQHRKIEEEMRTLALKLFPDPDAELDEDD